MSEKSVPIGSTVESVQRMDDWLNTQTSLGSTKDKSTGRSFQRRRRLSRQVLEALYEQSSIAARVVDKIVDDAFRTPWKLTGVNTSDFDFKKFDSDMQRLKVNEKMAEAARWSRLYGGALLLLPTHDTGPDGKPVPADQAIGDIQSLHPLATANAFDATPGEYDGAFGSQTFREVLDYQVSSGFLGKLERIHHTRVIPFEAIRMPPETLAQGSNGSNLWGPSVLDRLFDDLSRAGEAKSYAAAMLYTASLLFFKMEGFRKESITKDGPEKIRAMLGRFRAALDSLGVAAIDVQDEVQSVTQNVAGVHDLLDKMNESLVAASPMPKEILFNESPAGLNAGELSGPQELWFGTVTAYREEEITPALRRFLSLYFRAERIPMRDFEIEWEPLWTKSDEVQAETALKNAQTDRSYFEIGAITDDEIRTQRFVEGDQSPIRLEPEAATEPLDLSLGPILPEDVAAGVAAGEQAEQPEVPKIADQAMNGAQIASLITIAQEVQAGTLPRDSALGIIRAAFPAFAGPGRAEALLGSAGVGAPAASAAPAAAPAGELGEQAEGDEEPPPEHAPPPGETLQSPQEIGQQLGISPASVRAMHRRGEIGGWQIGGRFRFAASEVLAVAHRPAPVPAPEGDEDDGEAEDGQATA